MYPSVCPKILNIDICSDTKSTTVMKLGTMVLCGKVLQTIPLWVTSIQGQDHRGWWKNLEKLKHWHFLRHYDHYRLETWHNYTFWQGPSNHASLGDLYPGHGHRGWWKILIKIKHWWFFQMLWPLQSRNVAQRHFMAWPLRPFQLLWPSAKVTITMFDGKFRKTLAFSQTLSSLQS